MPPIPRRIMLVAGEASGDQHAAHLIRRLRATGNFQCCGMGGAAMREAGAELLVDSTPLAVVGIVEALRYYPALRRAFNTLKRALKHRPPDLLVLVDYPEFNLKLARVAARRGIKVLFYVAPQVWAWRSGRIRKIYRNVTRLAVILPFEEAFFTSHGVPVDYIGHPLIEDIERWERDHADAEAAGAKAGAADADAANANANAAASAGAYDTDTAAASANADSDAAATNARPHKKKTVLLLPGSRRSEIERLLPVLCGAAAKLTRRLGGQVVFRLLRAPGIDESLLAPCLQRDDFNCRLADGETWREMKRADAAISATGTSILQLALCGTPTVGIYKLSPVTWFVARRLVKIPYVSLVNIISCKPVIPELLQHEATPQEICGQAYKLLTSAKRRREMKRDFSDVRAQLGAHRSSERLAEIVREMTQDAPADKPAGKTAEKPADTPR